VISRGIARGSVEQIHELGIILLLKMVERAADEPVFPNSRRRP